jgi:hypothetical protein
MLKEDYIIHFDFEKVKAYFDGDKAILLNFLALVKTELIKSRADLENRFYTKDLPMLKEAGHKLKGTGLSAALPELTGIATQINKLVEFDQELVASLLLQLKREIEIILPLVEEKIEALK